jgi:beta-lactamase class A
MHAGGTATLHDLLEATLIYSDNTACDYLLRLTGGPSRADSLMASLGLDHIDISHSEGDLILLWAGVDPERGDSAWTRDRAYAMIEAAGDTAWRAAEARLVDAPSDAAPPGQMAQLLAKLQRHAILSRSSSDTLLAIMTRAATGRGRIAALLPPETPLAHKTGTISSTANDAGIITLPGGRGHVAIAVFVKGSRIGVRGRERAIAEAAKLVYDRIIGIAGQ